MPSDVQVFVRFKEQCVFAGEELHCSITFKNVAELQEPPTPGVNSFRHNRRNSINQLAAQNARANQTPRSPEERPRGRHQPSYSVSQPPTPPIVGNTTPPSDVAIGTQKPSHKHQRSVSILSMTSPGLPGSQSDTGIGNVPRNFMAHRRSSTMQLADFGRRQSQSDRKPSPDLRVPQRDGRRSPLSHSHSVSPDARGGTPESKSSTNQPFNTVPERSRLSSGLESVDRSHQRAPSRTSKDASQRTSLDIYTHENHSDETLMSEQVSMVSERPVARPRMPSEMIRQHYKMGSVPIRKPQAAKLLMGYAQVAATFTLDASLVDQTPFEEVKKKGYLGGQAGGGVVGVKKKARPTSGLFGGFNFASLGESLESIMGSDTSSSVKEMKAVANSRAVPLLSTPQSLLFVDLNLEPGEARSYSFSYRLPRGLPASYRGKAIKIVYNLTIGVQGAPGAREVQAVRQVNVPFKVYPGVDTDGEIFGHDLMQPHVILKDVAVTKEIDDPEGAQNGTPPSAEDVEASNTAFLDFVDTLLDRNRRRQSSTGSMIEPLFGRRLGGLIGTGSNRQTLQAIDRAIMMSNQIGSLSDTSTSPNRFEIARSGQRIAVVTLDRPLHRLGETVIVVVDFASDSDVVCASLRATLESSEKVTAGLAVRSAATVARVTRKVYASRAENVLFANRAVFCPTIPALVTPTFVTSGVSLDWYVKLEFGTVKPETTEPTFAEDDEIEEKLETKPPVLMEELASDERGVVEVAVETLDCDNFEVAIPITVYGDIVPDGAADTEDVVGIPI